MMEHRFASPRALLDFLQTFTTWHQDSRVWDDQLMVDFLLACIGNLMDNCGRDGLLTIDDKLAQIPEEERRFLHEFVAALDATPYGEPAGS